MFLVFLTHDMVRPDSGSDTQLQLLRTVHNLPRQITRVERRSDQDVRINNLFPELAVGAFFARGGDQGMTLFFQPVGDTELVLGGSQESGLLLCRLASVVEDEKDLHTFAR